MHDLRPDLVSLWRTTARLTAAHGARTLLFVAARSGQGTSSVAASFALLAAEKVTRTAWLVDLDLRRNEAFRSFENGFARDVGVPNRAFDASLGQDPLYAISPEVLEGSSGQKLMTAHQIGESKLLVTRFRNEVLRPAQKVQLRTAPKWWSALRRATDWIIVDAPALERSGAALAVANQMDGVVLVIGAEQTTADEADAMRQEIEAHGGKVVGAVVNNVRNDARFADRFSS
jgi:Mrp family chromosome partitioning ATPase